MVESGATSHYVNEDSHKDICACECACVRMGVEILRHVTAGGLMPMGMDGAEKETTVATATPSWSG